MPAVVGDVPGKLIGVPPISHDSNSEAGGASQPQLPP